MMRVAWILMAAAGVASYAAHTGVTGGARTPELATLPGKLGPFDLARDVPVSAAELEPLVPDRWLYREYTWADDVPSYLLIAYYGAWRSGGGGPQHEPEFCFRARQWEEVDRQLIPLDGGGHARLVNYEHGEKRTSLLYWTQWPGCRPRAALMPSISDRIECLPQRRPDAVCVSWEFPGSKVPDVVNLKAAVEDVAASLERQMQ